MGHFGTLQSFEASPRSFEEGFDIVVVNKMIVIHELLKTFDVLWGLCFAALRCLNDNGLKCVMFRDVNTVHV